MNNKVYNLVGVGIGPSNLSLAALLHPIKGVHSLFIERNKDFIWHKGMLLGGATLQVSFIKDLVTLVDPTNSFSFLNFLSAKNRLYRFSNTGVDQIKRKEFDQYYRWVTEQMTNLRFDSSVLDVTFVNNYFRIETTKGIYKSQNLSIGTGLNPSVPPCCRKYLGKNIFHSTDFLNNKKSFRNKKIAIIGGGQSGAEIMDHLIKLPESEEVDKIYWISHRYNFLPIDDSSFTNELYTPSYSEFFYNLSESAKIEMLEKQKLTSDGIDMDLLQSIYDNLYEKEVLDGKINFCRLLSSTKLEHLSRESSSYTLHLTNIINNINHLIDVDIVILATGYRAAIPDFLESIEGDFRSGDDLVKMNNDFSLPWNGPSEHKIFYQNGAQNIWGVPNPNLSLNAWRASKIINSMLSKEYYRSADNNSIYNWSLEKSIKLDEPIGLVNHR